MNRFLTTALSIVAASSFGIAGENKPETVPVVKTVEFDVQKTNPPALVVKVTGEVKSLGYTNSKLTRATYVTPPKDGVQDYTLTAVPPAGVAGQAIADVNAEDTWKDFEKEAPWLKGIRIKGASAGEKLVWVKADVTVTAADKSAKAKVGQIVEVQVQYGVFPPFPTDFEILVDGKAVPHSELSAPVLINGQAASGSTLNCLRFPVTAKGKLMVKASYKRGNDKTTAEIELEVSE